MPQVRYLSARPQGHQTTKFRNAAQGQQCPLHNQLLEALPAADFVRLRPQMKAVCLPRGTVVYGAGEPQGQLYFPTAGIFVRRFETVSGATIGLAITGSDGALGIASILGGDNMPSATLTLTSAHAYRISATTLHAEMMRGGPFARALLRYVQFTIAALGQDVACNRFHGVEQQLCRRLLSCLDRSASNALPLTHEMLANLLGVRRESVTATARKLQMAGALECRRGRITILNRALLETRACECYANVRREHARLSSHGDATARRIDVREPALSNAQTR